MRLVRIALAVAASWSIFPAVAHAQTAPAMSWVPAASTNYGSRNGVTIDMIVIHKAEGSLDSCVNWFANSAAKVSAQYCVDDTRIAQCVDDADEAWHCGNGPYNRRSIGIENSGFTFRNDFDDAHYRKLASLVSYLCAKYRIPMDRNHIIGHNEVPDPNHPGLFGGADHHQDPGPYFDWATFMSYVTNGQPAPTPTPSTPPVRKPNPVPAPSPAPAPTADHGVSVTVSAANVRDAAWGTILGTAPQGSGWITTGNQDQGFIEVYFRDGTGWISSTLLTGYTGSGVTVTASSLNVRNAAGTGSSIVGLTHAGQTYVAGGESPDGAWVLIRYDESKRWVYKSYTTAISVAP